MTVNAHRAVHFDTLDGGLCAGDALPKKKSKKKRVEVGGVGEGLKGAKNSELGQ